MVGRIKEGLVLSHKDIAKIVNDPKQLIEQWHNYYVNVKLHLIVSITECLDATTGFSHLVIWHQQHQSDVARIAETLKFTQYNYSDQLIHSYIYTTISHFSYRLTSPGNM